MNCAKCGRDNPSDNKFCENCGEPLAQATAQAQPSAASGNECPSCKHPNPPGSAFCEGCGFDMKKQTQPAVNPVPPSQPINQPMPPAIEKFLVLPDGQEIAIQNRRSIGRLDLAKYTAANEVMWVSRTHFDVFDENGTPYIIDEKSGNGTKLNGKEIKQTGKQQLKDGDEIIVGDAVKVLFKMKSH
jgi:hypothetical protein